MSIISQDSMRSCVWWNLLKKILKQNKNNIFMMVLKHVLVHLSDTHKTEFSW